MLVSNFSLCFSFAVAPRKHMHGYDIKWKRGVINGCYVLHLFFFHFFSKTPRDVNRHSFSSFFDEIPCHIFYKVPFDGFRT